MTGAETPPKKKSLLAGIMVRTLLAGCVALIAVIILAQFISGPENERLLNIAFFSLMGLVLTLSGVLLLWVNKTRPEGAKHVAAAPYAGAKDGLNPAMALFFNIVLIIMGLVCFALPWLKETPGG